MNTFLIAYSLQATDGVDRDYGPFYRAIQSLDAYARPLPSVWFVQTRLSLAEVTQRLTRHLGPDDGLVVMACGENAEWRHLEAPNASWLGQLFPRHGKKEPFAVADDGTMEHLPPLHPWRAGAGIRH